MSLNARFLMMAAAIGLTAHLSSCKPDAAPPSEPQAPQEVASTVDDLGHFKFHKTIANIPYPAADLFNIVSRAESGFSAGFLLPSERVSGLTTGHSKAISLGAYSVDMIYLSLFERHSELKRYFAASRSLANDLDAVESFDKAVSSNIMEALDNSDSAFVAINAMYGEVDGYLRSNERLRTATAMLLGSWIEAQFLSLSTVNGLGASAMENFEADFGQTLYQQKLTLYNLLNLLEEMADKEDFKPVIVELKNLNAAYADIFSPEDVKAKLPALLAATAKVRSVAFG